MSKKSNAVPIPKKKRKNIVTNELLQSLDVPNGGSVAIYDRLSRQARFYRHNNGQFTHFLTRDKRGKLIVHRDNDMIVSLNYDGTLIYGDPYHVFISESEYRRLSQENTQVD